MSKTLMGEEIKKCLQHGERAQAQRLRHAVQ